MTLTRRQFAGLGAGAGLAALGGCVASPTSGAATILTVADVHPGDFPTVTAVRWIGEQLFEQTGGRIDIRQYPSGQLGAEDNTIGLVRYGAIDLCRVAVAALNNAFPETRLLALPYVFRDTAHVRAVVDGPIGDDLLNVFEHRGLVGLAYYDAAPRCLYNVRHPVTEPGHLRGLKIRAPQSDIFLRTLRAMGANPTPLSFGVVFSSLQTHLIDGAENNVVAYQSSRQFEAARYWSQSNHCYSPDALLMSKDRLDSFAPADRDLIRDLARRSVFVMRQGWDAREVAAREAVVAAGVQIAEVDRDAFAATVRAMKDDYLRDPVLRSLYDRAGAV